jgi:hypothetical protein
MRSLSLRVYGKLSLSLALFCLRQGQPGVRRLAFGPN